MLAYHAQTVHSYFSVRNKSHFMDWEHQPNPFKIYPENFQRILLDKSNQTHRFLYLLGGITAQKSYPGVTYALRTNPSAGALYPTEVYVQIRAVEGFSDGIYHFNPKEGALVLLYALGEDEGIEPLISSPKINGFVFLFSALYYRSSWKYRERAFRYCLHDTGHMIGCLEMACTWADKQYAIYYIIDKTALHTLFGFRNDEFFLSSAVVGDIVEDAVCTLPRMQLPYFNATGFFETNETIETAYRLTKDVTSSPSHQLPCFELDKERLLEAIWKRRSIREFTQAPMKKDDFLAIMAFLLQPILSDCDTPIEIYAIINHVEGMPQGLWHKGLYIEQGDLRHKAGYLCLEQALGAQSGATLFLVGDDAPNYQALVQKAGIIGHRLYIISTYLGLGCSGIGAYYDEEVSLFLKNDGMVLYALAFGL